MKRIIAIIFIIILIGGCSTIPQYGTNEDSKKVSTIIDVGKVMVVGWTVYYFGSEMEWY